MTKKYTRKSEINLDELKEEIAKCKEQANKLISHAKKLEEYYSDWEDTLYKIEKKIAQAAEETGLTEEEITEYDALSDVFS